MTSVSVIIPNYNHAQFLKERMNSVLNQSFRQIEIIILDDCSDDGSKSLIEEYSTNSNVVHIEFNKKNSGSPFKQWKKGIELAKGELIWIAESDDIADYHFLDKVVPCFDDPEVGLVFTDCKIIDEKSELVHEKNPWIHDRSLDIGRDKKVWQGKDFLNEYQRYRNFVSNASSAVFRKRALYETLLEEIQEYRYSGDWLFWNKLSLKGKVIYLPEFLCSWRSHDQSTRSITNLEKDIARLKEASQVIKKTNSLLISKPKIKHYEWMINWWLSRYSYKNLVEFEYIFPSLPFKKLFLNYYLRLAKRTVKECIISIRKKAQ